MYIGSWLNRVSIKFILEWGIVVGNIDLTNVHNESCCKCKTSCLYVVYRELRLYRLLAMITGDFFPNSGCQCQFVVEQDANFLSDLSSHIQYECKHAQNLRFDEN